MYNNIMMMIIIVNMMMMMMMAVSSSSSSSLSATISISQTSISQTDDVFACVAMDFWPSSKCDYGYCPWYNNSIFNIDLNNNLIKNAMLEFNSNVHLRIGGSLGDFVVYDIGNYDTSKYCVYDDFSDPTNETHAGYELFSGCLKMEKWDEINQFAQSVKTDISFGINALMGRGEPGPCPEGTNCRQGNSSSFNDECCTNWTGTWDATNARAFMQYSKDKGYNIYAYEFGNELVGKKGIESHFSVSEYAEGWKAFTTAISDIYNDSSMPLVVVPDTTWMSDWYGEFLDFCKQESLKQPDIVTHHLYSLGAGSNPDVWKNAINATYLDQIDSLGQSVNEVVRSSLPSARIWIGEAGGAYNSGRDNVTNAMFGGFWYLDQLALFALNGHQAYCRQAFVGGFYSLLDNINYQPNPDYYNLLLWSRLMGKQVLRATSSLVSTDGNLRTYAQCTKDRKGSVTVLLINLSNTTTYTIENINIGENNLLLEQREEYIISSPVDLTEPITEVLGTKNILLNKNPLVVIDNKIPELSPVISMEKTIEMQPLTYGFVVFPQAAAAAC